MPLELGVCYYPEHWPQSTWEEDAKKMRSAGLRYVRIGEFAWSRLEPQEGQYDFSWLDHAFECLHREGLKVVLGTPTATPPIWLVEKYRDILQVGKDGRERGFGSRRHYCFNSTVYREKTEQIVSRLAERYGQHPALALWQTDNEYGCHDTTYCYCSKCRQAFASWLQQKYQTITELNEAWMTVFWSQEYSSFAQVPLPDQSVTESNPSLAVDFRRFSSDSVVSYNQLQVDIIRKYSGKPVYHNFMIFFEDFDHYQVAKDLDGVSWDNYPLGMLEVSPAPEQLKAAFLRRGHPDMISFNHDLYYGLKNKPFWVMEQQPGPVNWAPSNPLPAPGAVRLWSWQAFAHGADVVSYFRWRAAPGAQELMHAGLLNHDGTDDRAYTEASIVAQEIDELVNKVGNISERKLQVALIQDYENLWATDTQPHAAGWRYFSLQFDFYRALRQMGVDVAIVSANADLSPYKVVVAPALHLIEPELVDRLESYVNDGGQLVLGPRSGFKHPQGRVQTPAPGPLRSLVGATIRHQDALRPGISSHLIYKGTEYAYHTWADLLESDDAEVVGVYRDKAYPGLAAITQRKQGSGRVTYLGAWGADKLYNAVLRDILESAGVAIMELPEGVRVSRRGNAWFVLNFTDYPVPYPLPAEAEIVLGEAEVKPGSVLVFRLKHCT